MSDDTISRKAAIDAIVAQTIGYTVDEIKAECEENIFNENGYLGGLKDAIEAIEDISSAQPERCEDCENFSKTRLLIPQPQQRWIPCSERLPEEDGDYWVTADPRYVPPGYRSTDVITWRGGKWVMADYFVLDGEGRKMPDFKVVELAVPIIAWMPLPEPYREGES